MSQAYLYPIKTAGGAEVLPTANATLFTDSIPGGHADNWQAYVEFYSDAAGTVPVTPTAGTVTINATPMGNNYLPSPNSAVINATACSTPSSSYTPPLFTGRVVKGRAVLAGITGAAYCRITFWGY